MAVNTIAMHNDKLELMPAFTNEGACHPESRVCSIGLADSQMVVHYSLNLETNRFDYMSLSAIDVLGFTSVELKAMGLCCFEQRMHSEDRQRVTQEYEKNHSSEDIKHRIMYRFKCKDGTYRWILDMRNISYDCQHYPRSIIGTMKDITVEIDCQD